MNFHDAISRADLDPGDPEPCDVCACGQDMPRGAERCSLCDEDAARLEEYAINTHPFDPRF